MRTAAVPTTEIPIKWGKNTPHVRKALRFIKVRGKVTPEELVEWDNRNGRRLFEWDDDEAARQWRLQQARVFLNSFRAKFDGMRVRSIIHVREDADAKIPESAYYTVESISKHAGMREQVVADITRRMESLASELRMWNLSKRERDQLFQQLAVVMEGGAVMRNN